MPSVRVADVDYNSAALIKDITAAVEVGSEIVVTPELGITGYSCGDLFMQQRLLTEAEKAVGKIIEASKAWKALVAVGVPVRNHGSLYNCAAIIYEGRLLGLVPKRYLPEYGEYFEKRWFASGQDVSKFIHYCDTDVLMDMDQLFVCGEIKVGVEICEDLWAPLPPSTYAAIAGANVILNLSASNEVAGKHAYLVDLVRQQSGRLRCAYIYSGAGFGESSSDVVYSGNGLIAENGRLLASTERFSLNSKSVTADVDLQLLDHDRATTGYYDHGELGWVENFYGSENADIYHSPLLRQIEREPFVPPKGDARCEEISSIQIVGLARRLKQLNGCACVIGVSGGLDSTLALLVTVKAFDKLGLDRKNIHAITMPGFATTGRTRNNAVELCELLGVTLREIPIGKAASEHLKDIGHDGVTTDVTYENAQARERTQVLMDYANKLGGIVIGTGDLSELALGWCTYNGDHMSMYGVNAGVPKTLVRHLIRYYAEHNAELADVLEDILDTPVSPELVPGADDKAIGQLTEDIVGSYELHDFFLYNMVRCGFGPRKIRRLANQVFAEKYPAEVIEKWLRVFIKRFFTQQFKRNCLPDGPKVCSVCLSPRGDWRMPSDATYATWLNDLDDDK